MENAQQPTRPGVSNLRLHNYTIKLEELKGFVSRNVLCESYSEKYGAGVYKELIAITVISAKDYQPHTIISVRVNDEETLFGQDTKKAIEFYNQQ